MFPKLTIIWLVFISFIVSHIIPQKLKCAEKDLTKFSDDSDLKQDHLKHSSDTNYKSQLNIINNAQVSKANITNYTQDDGMLRLERGSNSTDNTALIAASITIAIVSFLIIIISVVLYLNIDE
jgi:hypothetical protein